MKKNELSCDPKDSFHRRFRRGAQVAESKKRRKLFDKSNTSIERSRNFIVQIQYFKFLKYMFKNSIIAGALVLASMGSYAASANLTVTGTIIPEACAVTLGNGGVADYGNLSSATVKSSNVASGTNSLYFAPPKSISLNVVCSAPTAIALNWTDNRASSRVPLNSDDSFRFGLGVSNGANVGIYQLSFAALQVAAATGGTPASPAGYLTRAKNTTGAWTVPTASAARLFSPTNALGFKLASGDATPPAIAQVSGNVSVEAWFSKTLVDSATSAITIDGSATVALEYI